MSSLKVSAGIYGYPLAEAARIALSTAIDYLREHDGIRDVRFVLFDRRTFEAFARELEKLAG